ncbi:hypothetical protein ZWY2020_016038 [Hordeum vulgare]|nr:hypothetical protein ZWY2020_016038 [Hordeum vulgare]
MLDPCRFPCTSTCYKCRPSPPPSPETRSTAQQANHSTGFSFRYIQVFDSSAEMGDAKSSWPELLGATSEVAKQKILSDRPDVRVFVVPVGNNVIGNFNDKRVRVFV